MCLNFLIIPLFQQSFDSKPERSNTTWNNFLDCELNYFCMIFIYYVSSVKFSVVS